MVYQCVAFDLISKIIYFSDNLHLYFRILELQCFASACPEFWHVPSHDEWNELTNFFGGVPSLQTTIGAQIVHTG